MKGDIRISKNAALILSGALSLFSMASFVSFVDADSAGGIIIEKETMDVGSIVLRIDDKNPTDIYGGTWELIREDATFGFGDGRDYSSSVAVGNNNPTVPVAEHTHTFTGNPLPNHSHSLGSTSDGYHGGTTYISTGIDTHGGVKSTHGASAGTPTGTISKSGISNATLDVRGKRLMVNVWKRIN